MSVINGTITEGGTAQNAIADGHNYLKVVLRAGDSDIYFNVGANADDGVGELVPLGQSATINFSAGNRLSVWCADTDATYTIRPTI